MLYEDWDNVTLHRNNVENKIKYLNELKNKLLKGEIKIERERVLKLLILILASVQNNQEILGCKKMFKIIVDYGWIENLE